MKSVRDDVSIKLRGDHVWIDDKRVAKVSDLVGQLPRQKEFESFIPPGVKLMRTRGNSTAVVHEMPPRMAQLNWPVHCGWDRSGEVKIGYKNVSVSLPYVVTMMNITKLSDRKKDKRVYVEDVWVFFRNKPLTSLNDKLYIPALYNIQCEKCGRGLVCMGKFNEVQENVTRAVRETISQFWRSSFNFEVRNNSWSYSTEGRRVRSLVAGIYPIERWSKNSKRDSRFGLTRKWKPAGFTLREWLDKSWPKFCETVYSNREAAEEDTFDLAEIVYHHGEWEKDV